MEPIFVTQREVNIHGKTIFEQVKQTKQPAIVVAHNQPRVAIISMEDYKEIERIRLGKSALHLANLVQEVRDALKGETLPTDLSEKHDDYMWENNS